jgi:Ni/Co efflux regulator RcnB
VRSLLLLQALALVAVPLASLAAQAREAPESPSGRRIVPCVGQLIEQIVIYAEAPSVASLRRVPIIAKIAQTMHVTTQPDVIDRFLLFRPGERCSELRRAESERITQYTQQSRFVNGRNFFQNGKQWVDTSAQNVTKRQHVQFNSDDYFNLLKKHPEAAAWMALGQNVLLALDDTVYEITD